MYIDNKAARDITESKGLTRKVKHLEIRDAFVRVMREKGIIQIRPVNSNGNRADLLTKAFGSPQMFIQARNTLLNEEHRIGEFAGECYGTSNITRLVNDDVGLFIDISGHPSGLLYGCEYSANGFRESA